MENKGYIERRTDSGIVFGYFTTFCNYMVSYLPTPHNLVIRIVMVLASTVFVAFGIFFVSAGRPDSACRRRLYAGGFHCHKP